MVHRNISIGESDSSLYIGVKPPLSDEQAIQISRAVRISKLMMWEWEYRQKQDHVVHDYTEFTCDIGDALDIYDQDEVMAAGAEVAQQIARILREQGDTANVVEDIAHY